MQRRDRLFEIARQTRGYMPDDEGETLYRAARAACERARSGAVLVEIGSWCGKSTLYLAAAAEEADGIVLSVDHHRGSDEQQPGCEHHDSSVLDARTARIDTLAFFRATITEAGVEDRVIPLVGDSATIGSFVHTAVSLLFIDGGHGEVPARRDWSTWAPKVHVGGLIAIHDVFEDPNDGGRPPYEIWRDAIDTGRFEAFDRCGSLAVIERRSVDPDH